MFIYKPINHYTDTQTYNEIAAQILTFSHSWMRHEAERRKTLHQHTHFISWRLNDSLDNNYKTTKFTSIYLSLL